MYSLLRFVVKVGDIRIHSITQCFWIARKRVLLSLILVWEPLKAMFSIHSLKPVRMLTDVIGRIGMGQWRSTEKSMRV